MVAKGQAKLAAKSASMSSSWNAAKSRMQSNYGAMPFGPTRKSNYNAGVSAATYHAPDPNKWAKNWQAKMSE
jgi:hypothetical protein